MEPGCVPPPLILSGTSAASRACTGTDKARPCCRARSAHGQDIHYTRCREPRQTLDRLPVPSSVLQPRPAPSRPAPRAASRRSGVIFLYCTGVSVSGRTESETRKIRVFARSKERSLVMLMTKWFAGSVSNTPSSGILSSGRFGFGSDYLDRVSPEKELRRTSYVGGGDRGHPPMTSRRHSSSVQLRNVPARVIDHAVMLPSFTTNAPSVLCIIC